MEKCIICEKDYNIETMTLVYNELYRGKKEYICEICMNTPSQLDITFYGGSLFYNGRV